MLPWVRVEAGTYRVNRRRMMLEQEKKVQARIEDGEAGLDAEQLRAMPMFQRADGSLLESVATSFASESRGAGEMVVREGDEADKFYIIARGKVEVWTTGLHGEKLRYRVMDDGDSFGEIALLQGGKRTANVETITPCILLTLDRGQFNALIDRAPELRASFDHPIDQVREQLRMTIETMKEQQ